MRVHVSCIVYKFVVIITIILRKKTEKKFYLCLFDTLIELHSHRHTIDVCVCYKLTMDV